MSAGEAGWHVFRDVNLLHSTDEGLSLNVAGLDAGVVSPPLVLPDGRDLWIRLRIQSESGGLAQLYAYRDAPSEAASQLFELPANQWREVFLPLPLGQSPTRLRFRPPGTKGRCLIQTVHIEEPGAMGVVRVSASAEQLTLTVAAAPSAISIVEVQPHESSGSLAAAPVVAEAAAGGARTISVPRFADSRDRLYCGFSAREAKGGRAVGAVHFVEDFGDVPRFADPIPAPASIKGLQVQMVDDAIALGVKQATLNVDLNQIVDLEELPDSYRWKVDGKTYCFGRKAIDGIPVKALSDAGIQVMLILLNHQSADPQLDLRLRHPR